MLKSLRTEHVSSDDVVRALTFCCSFIPATTGMLQTVTCMWLRRASRRNASRQGERGDEEAELYADTAKTMY